MQPHPYALSAASPESYARTNAFLAHAARINTVFAHALRIKALLARQQHAATPATIIVSHHSRIAPHPIGYDRDEAGRNDHHRGALDKLVYLIQQLVGNA